MELSALDADYVFEIMREVEFPEEQIATVSHDPPKQHKTIDPRARQYHRLVQLHTMQNQLKRLEDLYYDIAFHQGRDEKLEAIRNRIRDAKRKIAQLKQR